MEQATVLADFKESAHDHGRCIADAVRMAERVCERRRARLTPLRRRVLELIWASHTAVGAYDLLDLMRDDGRRVAPLTVYRALDFLRENGLIHRVESLNAYVGCNAPGQRHRAQLLICRSCRSVAELENPELARVLADSARELGFVPEQQTIEVIGLCPCCKP